MTLRIRPFLAAALLALPLLPAPASASTDLLRFFCPSVYGTALADSVTTRSESFRSSPYNLRGFVCTLDFAWDDERGTFVSHNLYFDLSMSGTIRDSLQTVSGPVTIKGVDSSGCLPVGCGGSSFTFNGGYARNGTNVVMLGTATMTFGSYTYRPPFQVKISAQLVPIAPIDAVPPPPYDYAITGVGTGSTGSG